MLLEQSPKDVEKSVQHYSNLSKSDSSGKGYVDTAHNTNKERIANRLSVQESSEGRSTEVDKLRRTLD